MLSRNATLSAVSMKELDDLQSCMKILEMYEMMTSERGGEGVSSVVPSYLLRSVMNGP